jgi:hypothetical protein
MTKYIPQDIDKLDFKPTTCNVLGCNNPIINWDVKRLCDEHFDYILPLSREECDKRDIKFKYDVLEFYE